MKITPRAISVSAKQTPGDMGEAVLINLSHHLQDTCVAQVYMAYAACRDLTQWVKQSLRHQPVPEVGGFLLGDILCEAPYDLYISHFAPARRMDHHSPDQLVLGANALLDLEKELSALPGAILLGWFHTHPGHTPFLSCTDLTKIHNDFFAKAYHIAMVTDCLTENYGTAIFTRKKSSLFVNNKKDFSPWINWKSLSSNI